MNGSLNGEERRPGREQPLDPVVEQAAGQKVLE
jgi:hypothetical protein